MIADQIGDRRQLSTLTAHGTDPDTGQTLAYSLAAPSLVGAAIDSRTTGVFTLYAYRRL